MKKPKHSASTATPATDPLEVRHVNRLRHHRGTSVVGLLVLLASAAVWFATSVAGSTPLPASIHCVVSTASYGDPVTCTAVNAEAISWPDNHISPTTHATHTILAVGATSVNALDASGTVVATTPIDVQPDLRIECEEGSTKPVYELADSDVREKGWDYVYRTRATGERVLPGTPGHPNGGNADHLERIVVEEVASTGICRLHSDAAELFGGDFTVSLESPWEPTVTHEQRLIGPASKTQWQGTQPAEVVGTVTVGDRTASERQGVYQSGCT